jgi:tyrosine decarboxylase / aspartate 1-decarboxylase
MKYWKRLSHAEQDNIITNALKDNINYSSQPCLGIPASRLDSFVFHDQAPFLKDAPLLRTYVQNPNHIGCHTLGESEPFFKGTQELEKEVIELLSVDLLKAAPQTCDGYIAAGGTEANLQAAWIYRNYFIRQYGAMQNEIALLGSEDTHYSIAKAANVLNLQWYKAPVNDDTREIITEQLTNLIHKAKAEGIKYFIVISNMATTMFGSIDNPDAYASVLEANGMQYKIHADGAFGGFIVPVSHTESNVNFANPHISSVTLDAHKLLQAPYGTGIFLARKGLMEYVYTKEAEYVNGMDITLCGSRSGANAIAVWMILFTYGPFGWLEKINKLLYRTDWCCKELNKLNKQYYRHPKMNIITIRAEDIPATIAHKHGLVPDSHHHPKWYKIVVMDHVELYQLEDFIKDLTAAAKA